jgi:alkylated DNA repair dioxygenase AlkB
MTPAATTTTVFQPRLDLRPPLETVRTHGAAFIDHALTDGFLDQLRRETDAVPYEPLAAHEGRARQEGETHVIHGATSDYPAIDRLRHELVQLIHTHGASIPGCSDWQPNETSIQRYRPGALGITPHLDLKRYHYLVAIITADGSAPFTHCKNRNGDPLTTWPAAAGSLALLRAPGFDRHDDGRPLHTVSGPHTGQRISVSYRMDTSAA